MSKELLKNTKFKSKAKSFFKKNSEEILDIIIFGSSVRNKEKPNDIDIAVIYKNKSNIETSYELKKEFRKEGFEVQILDLTYFKLIEGSYIASEGIISDGYSLVYDKFLSEGLGYINFYLFRYDLKGLTKSQRMRFYYSLYGRNKEQEGILKELKSIKFSDSILLSPIETSERMKVYLDSWNIKYIQFPIL